MDEISPRPAAGVDSRLPARRSFPPTTAGCLDALAFVRTALISTCATRLVAVAELVVGELASNAMIHARSVFEVRIEAGDPGLSISVRDGVPIASAAPELVPVWPHGLFVVAAAAAQWGVTADHAGKRVWAMVATEDGPPPAER